MTADRYEVEVGAGEGVLRIAGPGREPVDVLAGELRVADEDGKLLILSRKEHDGWRLVLEQPVDPAIRALLPNASNYGGWIDRFGLGKASVALAGVAAVVLFVGYSAPAWLAPFVPESWERNVGAAIVGDFGDNACRDPAAAQGLKAMASRIDPDAARHAPITMTLIDVGIFNAAALPGGQVIIFDGALDEAANPDAMAGILAHEIAHVRRRHVTQALIRELGIGALIRLFAGDLGANAQQLVSLSYTRSNEVEADGDAIAALKRAGVDPRPTAELFRKLARDEDSERVATVEFLNSHPGTKGRADRFAASWQKGTAYSPVISAGAYKAMQTACKIKHKAEKDAEERQAER